MGPSSEALNPASSLLRGARAAPTSPTPRQTLTLSVSVTSAPRVSSMRITSMCLCSAAQMMGVHPPLSCGWGEREEGEGPPSSWPCLPKQCVVLEHRLQSQAPSMSSTSHMRWASG